jgi:hypothetical protein
VTTAARVRTLTPDLWAMLPKATTDCLTAWWESVGFCPLLDITQMIALEDGSIEVERIIRDRDGHAQVDHASGSPPVELLKETRQMLPTQPVPDCWPVEGE